MTKFKDFKELIMTNINAAEEIMTGDFCYGMGVLSRNEEVDKLSLSELDDAYDKTIYMHVGKYGDWMLYVNDSERGTTETLGMISGAYERYQIARFLTDLYLTFYQNMRIY